MLALRSLLDGGVAPRPAHVRIIVTANRRAITMREDTSAALHERDERDDALALADRFGLALGFHPADKRIPILAILAGYTAPLGLAFDPEEAIAFAIQRGNRSGRTRAAIRDRTGGSCRTEALVGLLPGLLAQVIFLETPRADRAIRAGAAGARWFRRAIAGAGVAEGETHPPDDPGGIVRDQQRSVTRPFDPGRPPAGGAFAGQEAGQHRHRLAHRDCRAHRMRHRPHHSPKAACGSTIRAAPRIRRWRNSSPITWAFAREHHPRARRDMGAERIFGLAGIFHQIVRHRCFDPGGRCCFCK